MPRFLTLVVLLGLLPPGAARGQDSALKLMPLSPQDEIIDVWRAEIAAAPDGSFALAWEALIRFEPSGFESWRVLVQRFDAAGQPLSQQPYLFEGESSTVSIWTSDIVELPELEFMPDGTLLVLMLHRGELSIGGDGVRATEATLAAIAPDGEVLDLTDGPGVQAGFFFPSGQAYEDSRPRLAVAPDGSFFVLVERPSDASNLYFIAVKPLDANGNEIPGLEEIIPHDDPNSQGAFHYYGDVASNGNLSVVVWSECPVVDNQGNADQCDVGAQFFTNVRLGGNIRVNDDNPNDHINFKPSVAMNAAGNSVVVWYENRDGNQGDVYGQRFNAGGERVGGNFRISAGDGVIENAFDRPEVAMRNDGGFMVVWYDSAAAGFQAKGRTFDANGQAQGPPVALSNRTGFETGFPDITTDGTRFLYTWIGSNGGGTEIFTNTPAATAGEPEAVPDVRFELHAYPNPFTSRTTVAYALTEAGPVQVDLYDILGRHVRRLVDEPLLPAGTHDVRFDAGTLPPGTYLARLRVGDTVRTQKLVLVR